MATENNGFVITQDRHESANLNVLELNAQLQRREVYSSNPVPCTHLAEYHSVSMLISFKKSLSIPKSQKKSLVLTIIMGFHSLINPFTLIFWD